MQNRKKTFSRCGFYAGSDRFLQTCHKLFALYCGYGRNPKVIPLQRNRAAEIGIK
jgi:hypothetical protein